jgi:hypothetical protein
MLREFCKGTLKKIEALSTISDAVHRAKKHETLVLGKSEVVASSVAINWREETCIDRVGDDNPPRRLEKATLRGLLRHPTARADQREVLPLPKPGLSSVRPAI